MSLTDWLSPSGLAALAKIGWPEWEDKRGIVFKMFCVGEGFCYDHDCRTGVPMHLDDHAALCIIRDWAREKLHEEGTDVRFSWRNNSYIMNVKFDGRGFIVREENGVPQTLGDNYDAALIAAIGKGMK